jgi:sulfate adenylyltransferase subunit 2
VRNVQDAIDQGKWLKKPENILAETAYHNTLDAIEEFKFDACIGGARRERKSRAKERIFSVRDDFGQWDEKTSVLNYSIC